MHLDIGYEASDVGRHTFSGIATQAIRTVFYIHNAEISDVHATQFGP